MVRRPRKAHERHETPASSGRGPLLGRRMLQGGAWKEAHPHRIEHGGAARGRNRQALRIAPPRRSNRRPVRRVGSRRHRPAPGAADIGLVSRALKDDEKDLLPFTIVLDGICVILHNENPVASLQDDQVVAIYTGKISNWKEVGGKDAPITVVNKAEGRSTLELFCHYYRLRNSDIRAKLVIGDNQQGIKTVAGNPDSIGYVSIAIPRGEITSLVGPSGCGKTSFISCLNRLSDLIPGASVSGSIRLGETEVTQGSLDVISLRRRVGMIFQKPNPFPLSIRKNLEFPLREHGMRDRSSLDRTIEQALGDVGLWEEVKDRLTAPALSLSGGQQQRLSIARALALRPEILLLDEPCSALDPISSGIVEDLIKSLKGRYTLVIVTHNLAQARRIADSVAVFWVQNGTGRLIEHGSTRQIFESPRDPLTSAYVIGTRG
jgi:phosphate transport system ATP-binding protein